MGTNKNIISYYQNLPRKRMGVGVLIFNEQDELLLVKPVYKDHWSVPGGVIDENESPKNACYREIKEEIGIDIRKLKFICVDYLKNNPEKGESLQFIFYGGNLKKEQINKIRIKADEIGEYRFIKINKLFELIGTESNLGKRLVGCLVAIEKNCAVYLEDGK